MADTITDSTVEGKIINDIWISMGDNDSNNRHISLSSMWRFLRMSVEQTDDDLDGWSPTAITTQSAFTISPVPSTAQIRAIKKCMLMLIHDCDYKSMRDDGVGIVFRGGLDTIDSKTLLLEARKATEDARLEYRREVVRYNNSQSGATYYTNDVYSTSRPDQIGTN